MPAVSFFASVAFATILCFRLTVAAVDESLISPNAERNLVDSATLPKLIDRSTWGGKPSLRKTKLQHPVDLVIVAHTATRSCKNFDECSGIVKAAQRYHFSLGRSDIAYNFLIGGDGHVYEGRGWDCVNFQRNQSISVSFIGNYLVDYLSEDMIDAFQDLLSEGVELGKLKKDYRIVCHNQTVPTLSPGVHVYKVVKTWPHFQPGTV